ncbi:helix-turn-helix domain-containing protein [Rhizobium leguminosarum]|uniref:helix-turn-helix domain-containing protein n=1 Tax=Rhizobium leguminosarum TaxID=384 RepID=UPI001C97AB1B|nr:helix-turn-helix domain-containing protein [Rhizobium leguminosarum]MBY5700927.1 helix-turn-helix domain-containing protein [Rhizobium leguminosarum]
MSSYKSLSEFEIQDLATSVNNSRIKAGWSVNELAKRAGVSQPMVHRVVHGRIRKITPNIRRLLLYIRITSGLGETPDFSDLNDTFLGYLAAGGTVEELRAIIVACTRAREIGGVS